MYSWLSETLHNTTTIETFGKDQTRSLAFSCRVSYASSTRWAVTRSEARKSWAPAAGGSVFFLRLGDDLTRDCPVVVSVLVTKIKNTPSIYIYIYIYTHTYIHTYIYV